MFEILAPAKLNLFLHVTGRRADGYHTLQSLMVFADVGDTLTFAPQDSLTVEVNGPFAARLSGENLVEKAARLLATHYKIEPRAKITLTKNLPVAAGLGGGSSDAAATLQGLAQLWALQDEPDVLLGIASKLGADVPACLHKKPLWAEGLGEKITPLPKLPALYAALVNPLVPTPTAEVFKKFNGRFSTSVPLTAKIETIARYRNDLTGAAIAVTPVITDVLSALTKTGCIFSRLSGSGATCFGLYATEEAAHSAAETLQKNHPQWWIKTSNILK